VEFKDCAMGQIKPVFHSPGSSPVDVEYAVSANYLASISDDDFWNWLGTVTGGKIVRPAISLGPAPR